MSLERLSQFCESSPHVTAIYGPYRPVHAWKELSHHMSEVVFNQKLAKCNSIKLLKQLGVNIGLKQKDMRFGPMDLEALIKVRFKQQFGPLHKKYLANKKQLETVVATLKGDAAHRIEIRHTLHVTWLLRLRACDLDDDAAYLLSEDDDHARQWGGDFEHGIDWDLVHCHYELPGCLFVLDLII